jgi:hypothetical protein
MKLEVSSHRDAIVVDHISIWMYIAPTNEAWILVDESLDGHHTQVILDRTPSLHAEDGAVGECRTCSVRSASGGGLSQTRDADIEGPP